MTVTLHVVKIRACSQCGEVLPQKCDACLKHPNRKPKVIELYNFPHPLKVAECGCCFKFKCQRPSCPNTFWRSVKNNVVEGKTRSATLVCGRECRAWVANESRMNAEDLPCGWCNKILRRQRAQIPTSRVVFCNGSHWQLYRKRKFLEARKADSKRAFVMCPPCEEIVECTEVAGYGPTVTYKCNPYGHSFKLGANGQVTSEPRRSTVIA